MFKNIVTTVRRWLYNLGLIQGVQKLDDKKDIHISEEMFAQMDVWKNLYQGYHKPFHEVSFRTIANGVRTRNRETLNMAKVVSEELATLIFNERCQINFSDDTLRENIENVLDNNGFRNEFQRYLEYMLSLGGLAIKGHVDNGELKLSYVKADSFIPTGWTNKKITEGIFVNEIVKGDKLYTHLEWHYWEKDVYYIKHELYEKEKNSAELGVEVGIKRLYSDLEPLLRLDNVERSLFVYIKPNSANNVDLDSPMGISVYANALDTIKAIDIAFDSYIREFRLGKKRILVPASAIKAVNDPETGAQHRYFDAEDEVYEAFKFDDPEAKIQDNSVELRVDEHIAAINSLLNLYAMQTGFSAGTFSFDGQSMKTATEVVSENSKTFRTKQSHELMVQEGLKELVEIILDLAEIYELFSRPEGEYEVTVSFDDSVAEDKMGDLQYWTQLVTNDLASRKRAIGVLLGLTEDEIEEEIRLIAEERQLTTPENIDFFGLNSNEET